MIFSEYEKSVNHPERLTMRWYAGPIHLSIGFAITGLSGFAFLKGIIEPGAFQGNILVLTPFILAGIAVTAWCRGLIIRRSENRICCWHGIALPRLPAIPLYCKTLDVSGVSAVIFYGIQRSASKGSINRGPAGTVTGGFYESLVELERLDGKVIPLLSFRYSSKARLAAKKIAMFLHLTLAEKVLDGQLDVGPGSMTRTDPDDLALNLRARLSRAKNVTFDGTISSSGRIRIDHLETGARLVLPKAPLRSGFWSYGLLAVGGICGGFVGVVQGVESHWFGVGLFMAIPGIVGLFVSVLVAAMAARQGFLELVKGGLLCQWSYWGWRGRRLFVPVNDIESMEEIPEGEGTIPSFFGPVGPAIRLITDTKILQFGWGLTHAERKTLHALLRAHVVA